MTPVSASDRCAARTLTAGPRSRRRLLGAGAGVLGGEGLAACLHPVLGEALAAADIVVPLAIALVLLAAILRGNSETCERVFRLLRWIDGQPEPAAPGSVSQLDEAGQADAESCILQITE